MLSLFMFMITVPLDPTKTPLYIPKLLLSNCDFAEGVSEKLLPGVLLFFEQAVNSKIVQIKMQDKNLVVIKIVFFKIS